MPPTVTQAVLRWSLGVSMGTALVAVTSPFFIRSYVLTPIDPVRKVWTLEPGSTYRWRSEGYANTHIGPMGMPGVSSSIAIQEPSIRSFAIWGDSQAEGVSVADEDKIFAMAEQLAIDDGNPIRVYPLARSGDDVRDWLVQMPRVESPLELAGHVMLVVDLDDLIVATGPSKANDRGEFEQSIAKVLPAFVIQAVRNIAYEPDGVTRRTLRFGVGQSGSMIQPSSTSDKSLTSTTSTSKLWAEVFATIRKSTSMPVIVLYAGTVPGIMQGKLQLDDPNAEVLPVIRETADLFGITWIDLHGPLTDSVRAGIWPRGFHNGQFGVGHLNQRGNQIVARTLIDAVNQLDLKN